MVSLPCGDGNHILHSRCVLVAVRSGGAQRGIQAPLVCSERRYGARHGRREALDTAVQADPSLRDAAVALRGGPKRTTRDTAKGSTTPETKIVWEWQIL